MLLYCIASVKLHVVSLILSLLVSTNSALRLISKGSRPYRLNLKFAAERTGQKKKSASSKKSFLTEQKHTTLKTRCQADCLPLE